MTQRESEWDASISARGDGLVKRVIVLVGGSTGSALGTPADDFEPGHVEVDVINDIALWVMRQAGDRS